MAGLMEDLNKRRDAMHPVLLAAYAHRRLVDIHLPGRQRAHRPAPDESDPGEQGLLCGLHPAHPAP